ncbi:MAG: hypothetical protein VB031_02495 [Eubacteriaceae bacterium]|nr:hypothetical protein [Eubacteriaceae bacterium]
MDAEMKEMFELVRTGFERIDKRFDQVDARFEQVDKRLDQVDARFEQVDKRFDQVDVRFEQVDIRFNGIESKIDTIFAELADFRKEMNSEIHALHGSVQQVNIRIDKLDYVSKENMRKAIL